MGPPAPSFDYYAELEVSKSATLAEITTSYRRLARVHHPDKNPDNPDAATAKFQKVQQAYETLSNIAGRKRYDTFPATRGHCSCGHCCDEDEDEEWCSDYEDEDDDYYYDFAYGAHGSGAGPRPRFSNNSRNSGFTFGGSRFRTYEDMEKFFQEQERKDILRAKALAEERRKREEAEVQKREEREAAKKAEEEAIERDKLARKDSERLKQENLWEEAGAVTKDEKLATCLHSDNCTKVPQRKKFKCGTCGKKGGMTAFECPFCSSFLCQQCVVKFSERRTKGISIPKPKSQPEDESDPEEVIEEEPEPVTEPPPDIPAEITPVSSFETQHTIPKPHSRNYSAPHKDLEDKYGIIGDQASKVSKTNKKEGHSAQAKMSPIHTPKPSISTSGVKANGTVGHGSTKRPFPVSSGVSSASAYGQLPEQQPQPQPQARVHVTNGYVPKKPQSTTPFQKDRPKTNRFHAKTVSNGMLAATELAPKTNGIPGLEPFPPPAPEHAVPDEVSPDESSVHSDFNPPTAPSSMSHFRKPQVNGFMSQPVFACYICGGTNHMARNCSQPRTCYNCGKTGHLSKDCGTSGAVHERPPAVLSDGPDPRTLIPDFQKAYPEDSMTSAKVCIRGATLARGITEPLLRKAMESFGPISECTIDRKAGVAWAVFVDAAVARNAIAASPVPVAKGAIRISGWSGGR